MLHDRQAGAPAKRVGAMPGGVPDRLTDFSCPVTGSYHFAPSLNTLNDLGGPEYRFDLDQTGRGSVLARCAVMSMNTSPISGSSRRSRWSSSSRSRASWSPDVAAAG